MKAYVRVKERKKGGSESSGISNILVGGYLKRGGEGEVPFIL